MKRALLLVAHGSRRAASNDEVRQLTAYVAKELTEEFEIVTSAFLELSEPSIPEGIGRCVKLHADHIVVLPFFLSAGRHVSKDIPSIIDEARAAYPDIKIEMRPYIGASPEIISLLAKLAKGA